MQNIVVSLMIQVILILLNAVFACAEIAVISTNDNKLEQLAGEGDKKAARLLRFTKEPARFLATIQVAITLSGFLGSAFAADNFSDALTALFLRTGIGISPAVFDTISVIVITLILSYFTLIFGELVPKRLAMRHPQKLAMAMTSLLSFISKLFAPIVWLLTISTNGMLRLLGVDPTADDEQITEEEILLMVDAGSEKGAIDTEEKEMIENIFAFDDTSIDKISTHRTQVDILWADDPLKEWDDLIFQENSHSFYPVCGQSADDVLGIIYIKDYLRLRDRSTPEQVMKTILRPAYFVPETIKADKLFQSMKQSKKRFAITLDEYGGLSGIITMNDLISCLVGEFDADDTDDTDEIKSLSPNVWSISGAALIDDVNDVTGFAIEDDDVDTWGGFIINRLGFIPDDGAVHTLDADGLHIQIKRVENHQIKDTLVSILPSEEEPNEKQ